MFGKVVQFYEGLKEDTPILRCVFGVTLALLIATSLGYLVPHLTAIFALMFLEPSRKKPLGLKLEIILILAISLFGYIGVLLGNYLIDYPLVIMPVLGLIIFWTYRLVKIPQPVRLLFLILATLIPFVSINANLLGNVVLWALLFNLIIALVVVRIAFFLFPVQQIIPSETTPEKENPYAGFNLDKLAFNSLLVVFPLVLVFYIFNTNVAILTMVFVVLLSFDPFVYQSKKGIGLLAANALGGLAGIIVYNILVIAPSYLLYIFVSLSVAFYFVRNLYSEKKIAPIFKISFNTFFVVMGVISTSTEEGGTTIWERLIQIGLAVIYVIMAFKIVNKLNPPKINMNEA